MAVTRSMTRRRLAAENDRLARDVFEQPPVLDLILNNLVHEDDTLPLTLLELDLVSLRLVFKSPVAVDVIEAHKERVFQLRHRRRLFMAQLNETMFQTLPEHAKARREHLYRVLDLIVKNKDLLDSPFFDSMRRDVRTLIEQNALECPVFRARAPEYLTALTTKNSFV